MTTTKKQQAVPKKEQAFEQRDWTYLQDKDPSELHVVFAREVSKRSEIDVTPQQVQAVLAMHPHFQRSRTNKARATYRPLDVAIVKQRSAHMSAAHEDAAVEIAARAAKPTPKRAATKKATPTPKKTAAKAPAKAAKATKTTRTRKAAA